MATFAVGPMGSRIATFASPSEPLLPARFLTLPRWLTPAHAPLSKRTFWLLLALVWALGVVVRYLWYARVGVDLQSAVAHGAPLLTTGDGYFWGLGSDVALSGNDYGLDRIPAAGQTAIVCLGWLVTKLSPWSLDTVMFYLPPFVAALVAIPTALLARTLVGPRLALLAGLLAVVSPRFALRTAPGYFDTDLFAVTAPLVAAYFLVRMSREGRSRDALIGALILATLPFFYDQGGPVGAAIALCAAGVLVVYHRQDALFAPALAVVGMSQLPLPWALRAALLVPVWFALGRVPLPPRVLRWVGLAIALAGFALSAEWGAALAKIGVFTGSAGPAVDTSAPDNVVLGDTTRFVTEVARGGISGVAGGVAGSLAAFLAALVGFALLQLRHRAVAILLPFAALALFALVGGNRFEIYGVAPAALGIAALVGVLVAPLRKPLVRLVAVAVLGGLAVAPAAVRVAQDGLASVVAAEEVEAFDALAKVVKPGDLTIAWWDYGYPLGYFAHADTLVDGGLRGEDAAIAAEVLLSPSQRGAAILARLAAETKLRAGRGNVARLLFDEAQKKFGLGQIDFLRALTFPMYPIPARTHDVYLYLPLRMTTILEAISLSRPVEVGHTARAPKLGLVTDVHILKNPDRLDLGHGAFVDPEALIRRSPGRDTAVLKTLYVVNGTGADAKLQQRGNPKAPAGAPAGIFMASIGVYYEFDDTLAKSLYVQLGLFHHADPTLYELVFANSVAVIYRLKI